MKYLLEEDILESWHNYELDPYDIINLYQYGYISENLMDEFLKLEEVQEAVHVYLNEGIISYLKNKSREAIEKAEDTYHKIFKGETPAQRELRKMKKAQKGIDKQHNKNQKTIKDINKFTDDLIKQNNDKLGSS